MKLLRLSFCALCLIAATGPTFARNIRVTADGNVAAAIAEAKPGDTIVLADGHYKGQWRLPAGKPGAPVTLKAGRPGRVFVGAVDFVHGFQPVEGMRYTYAVGWPATPEKLRELDTGTSLRWMAALIDVEEVVGSYAYDEKAKRLYVHPSDSAGVSHHAYAPIETTVGVTVSSHTVVDGLVMTGFGNAAVSGQKVEGVTIRDCKVFRNGSGIMLGESRNCIVRNNEAWENRPDYSQGSQISFIGPTTGMLIEGNIIRRGISDHNGMFIYSGQHANNVMRRNILSGARDACSKPYGKDDLAEFNVSTSGHGLSRMRHNTYRHGVWAKPDTDTDLVLSEFKQDPKFADPAWLDFRLQSDSPARGKAKDGSDLGAYQYRGDVFFVTPDGNDEGHGTSVEAAWKTLGHATKTLKPGQTLYLLPGTYDEPLRLEDVHAPEGRRTVIRVHGKGKAWVHKVEIVRCSSLELAGIHVRGVGSSGFEIASSKDVLLRNCAAYDNKGNGVEVNGTEAVSLRRCAFWRNRGAGIVSSKSSGTEVVSCIVADNREAQILRHRPVGEYYGNFNAFRGKLGQTGQLAGDLTAWRKLVKSDERSGILDIDLPGAAKGDFRIPSKSALKTAGLYDEPVGPDGILVRKQAAHKAIERVEVLSVTRTTANLLWYTPGRMCGTALHWGDTEKYGNLYDRGNENDSEYELVHTVSIVNLKPNTTYHFRPGYRDFAGKGNPLVWDDRDYTFTTATVDPEPRRLYVSLKGDDRNDGFSPERAWGSLHHAAREARLGDVVTILPGRYQELLRPLQTGASEDRRIVFRAEQPLTVFLDGGLIRHKRPGRPHNVQLHGKAFITIENIVGERCSENTDYGGYRGGWGYAGIFRQSGGAMNVYSGCIADGRYRWMAGFCFFDGGQMPGIPKPEYAAKIVDSVAIGCWRAICGYTRAPLLLDHNVYYVNLTGMFSKFRGPGQWISRNSIYQDLIFSKRSNGLAIFGRRVDKDIVSDYSCFAWMPESDRVIAGRGKGALVGLAAWRERTGCDKHSLEHLPGYSLTALEPTPPGKHLDPRPLTIADFVLPKDSPLRGKANDGGNIGVRWEKWTKE